MKGVLLVLALGGCAQASDPSMTIDAALDLIDSIEDESDRRAREDARLVQRLRSIVEDACLQIERTGRSHPACR